MFFTMMIHDGGHEEYILPEGGNFLIYGISVFVTGAYLAVINPT